MGEPTSAVNSWAQIFEDFLQCGSKVNATFASYLDIMQHCDYVVEIAFPEWLGGPDGYDLVVAAIKERLKFPFVNNVTSPAPYCVQLLHKHLSARYFHVFEVYSIKDSNCHTKKEFDHIDTLKGFQSGSNITAITSHISLMDTLNEVKDYRTSDKKKHSDPDSHGSGITDVDEEHRFPKKKKKSFDCIRED